MKASEFFLDKIGEQIIQTKKQSETGQRKSCEEIFKYNIPNDFRSLCYPWSKNGKRTAELQNYQTLAVKLNWQFRQMEQ